MEYSVLICQIDSKFSDKIEIPDRNYESSVCCIVRNLDSGHSVLGFARFCNKAIAIFTWKSTGRACTQSTITTEFTSNRQWWSYATRTHPDLVVMSSVSKEEFKLVHSTTIWFLNYHIVEHHIVRCAHSSTAFDHSIQDSGIIICSRCSNASRMVEESRTKEMHSHHQFFKRLPHTEIKRLNSLNREYTHHTCSENAAKPHMIEQASFPLRAIYNLYITSSPSKTTYLMSRFHFITCPAASPWSSPSCPSSEAH